MKVFVTGGNGFLGSRTLVELIQSGYQVRCLLRKNSSTDRIRDLPIETHFGDVRDLNSLVEGIRGCDAVIHMACISSWAQIRAQESELDSIAVGGTENILHAARLNPGVRVVHVSSCAAVNGSKKPTVFNETSPFTLLGTSLKYSLAKYQAEQIVNRYTEKFGLDVVTVNPCEIYGANDVGFVTAGNLLEILKWAPTLVCSGGTAVAHVDDVARGVVLALEKGRKGERYILGGENLSIADLAKMVRRLAGRSQVVVSVPNKIIVSLCNSLAKYGIAPPIPKDVLDYAVLYWFVDSGKAERELGYRWRSAEKTISDVVQWFFDAKLVA